MDGPGQLAASLRAQLAVSITHQLGSYAGHLVLVVEANPQGSAAQLLDRPDLRAALGQALATARAQALANVSQVWSAAAQGSDSPVAASLLADVSRAYDEAPGQITRAVTAAYHSVPDQPFTPGVDAPGTNPGFAAALARAQAVRGAVERHGQSLALRNGLSVDVAASSGRTAAILGQAGPRAGKRWVASMDGHDPGSCAWCRRLHGAIVSVGHQFPHPEAIGGHSPPRVYRGELAGPPLHPNCRCRIEIVPAPELPVVPAETVPAETVLAEPGDMVSSDDIKALPVERYDSLVSFLRSALHELGQLIKTILGIGAG